MRRSPWLITSVLVTGVLLGATGSLPPATAREVTPAVVAPASWNIPGIEVIASVSDPSLAPGMVLEFDRITWAPGFAVPMHYHPAIDILYVVSGSVAWSVEEGTAQVQRAAVDGTPAPAETLEPVIMLDPVLYDPSQELTQFPEGVTPVSEG